MTTPSLVLWALLAPSAGPLLRVVRAASSPEPADGPRTPPPELVTPGTVGFLAIFAVAVALVFLVRDMVRRNRRLVVRAERRDAELRAQAAEAAARGDGPGPGPDAGPPAPADPPGTPRPGGGGGRGPSAPLG